MLVDTEGDCMIRKYNSPESYNDINDTSSFRRMIMSPGYLNMFNHMPHVALNLENTGFKPRDLIVLIGCGNAF